MLIWEAETAESLGACGPVSLAYLPKSQVNEGLAQSKGRRHLGTNVQGSLLTTHVCTCAHAHTLTLHTFTMSRHNLQIVALFSTSLKMNSLCDCGSESIKYVLQINLHYFQVISVAVFLKKKKQKPPTPALDILLST